MRFIGAFESTYMPYFDVDSMETSQHTKVWIQDLSLMLYSGVTELRYPIRWHRIEQGRGVFDWKETDERLAFMESVGMRPIVDLLHHTSYPRWIRGFHDERFPEAFLNFCERFAERYPHIKAYTLLNEPFTTLFLCGHEGIWSPHWSGIEGFVKLARNVLPTLFEASRLYRELLPEAEHYYVEPCEGHSASIQEAEPLASIANDRRFFVLDLIMGKPIADDRPFVQQVLAAGGSDLLELEPGNVDVLGLDYYAHMEWCFGRGRPSCPSPQPEGLKGLIMQYWDRYRVPMILGETNIRGYSSDRASWLRYTLEQCELAVAAGADLRGYCWLPFIDSFDWDSMLTRYQRHLDPVGVYWLDDRLDRRESVMSEAYRSAARGARSWELPAYRFQPPVDRWLKGLLPQMAHWDWIDPPADAVVDWSRAGSMEALI